MYHKKKIPKWNCSGNMWDKHCCVANTLRAAFQWGIVRVTCYQVAWKDPCAVEGCSRRHLVLHFHCTRCRWHISRQNRHGQAHGVSQASLSYQFCLLWSACNFPHSYLSSISSSCSVYPAHTSSYLSHFHRISSASPANCFLHVPFIFFWSCQSSHFPHSPERWAHVSPGYSVSGTFQLACIPASGSVTDKMEQIPPGYCYLCFPAVTHKQAYTFTHMHSHMSLYAWKMPGRWLLVLQMHWTDSSPTRGGQAL